MNRINFSTATGAALLSVFLGAACDRALQKNAVPVLDVSAKESFQPPQSHSVEDLHRLFERKGLNKISFATKNLLVELEYIKKDKEIFLIFNATTNSHPDENLPANDPRIVERMEAVPDYDLTVRICGPSINSPTDGCDYVDSMSGISEQEDKQPFNVALGLVREAQSALAGFPATVEIAQEAYQSAQAVPKQCVQCHRSGVGDIQALDRAPGR